MNAAENRRVVIDPPQRGMFPPERLADGLENLWRRLAERRGLDQDSGGDIFGGQPAVIETAAVGQLGHHTCETCDYRRGCVTSELPRLPGLPKLPKLGVRDALTR